MLGGFMQGLQGCQKSQRHPKQEMHPPGTVWLLYVLEMGENLEKLPASCQVGGESRPRLWRLWLWMGL